MKEAPDSSETSVLTRATWRNNPKDTILLICVVVHCFSRFWDVIEKLFRGTA
jgi:hypothetical protein